MPTCTSLVLVAKPNFYRKGREVREGDAKENQRGNASRLFALFAFFAVEQLFRNGN